MAESLLVRKAMGGEITVPTFTFVNYRYAENTAGGVPSFEVEDFSISQTGDLLVFIFFSNGAGTTNENKGSPIGVLNWVEIMDEFDSADTNLKAYACINNGISSQVSGLNMGTQSFIIALIFRPSIPISLVGVTHYDGDAVISDPTAQTINFSNFRNDLSRIAIAVYGASGVISGETSSVTMTEIAQNSDFQIRYKIYGAGTAGESISIDMADEGDNALAISLVSAL